MVTVSTVGFEKSLIVLTNTVELTSVDCSAVVTGSVDVFSALVVLLKNDLIRRDK